MGSSLGLYESMTLQGSGRKHLAVPVREAVSAPGYIRSDKFDHEHPPSRNQRRNTMEHQHRDTHIYIYVCLYVYIYTHINIRTYIYIYIASYIHGPTF